MTTRQHLMPVYRDVSPLQYVYTHWHFLITCLLLPADLEETDESLHSTGTLKYSLTFQNMYKPQYKLRVEHTGLCFYFTFIYFSYFLLSLSLHTGTILIFFIVLLLQLLRGWCVAAAAWTTTQYKFPTMWDNKVDFDSCVPFPRTQFQTSGIGPRHEGSVSNESYWSSNLPSSIMMEDNSILSFQAVSKRQQDVSGQPRVDTCDTVSVLPLRRHSVFTQTETPRRVDAHLNTEVSMADLDCFEVSGADREQWWQERQ